MSGSFGNFFGDDPTGPLIQLTALGIQNAYLNLQSQYTLFKRTYKRHTNYAVQMVFVAATGGACRLGTENTFKVTRNGDLICETYFCAYLPVCGVDTTPNAYAKAERGFVTNKGLLNTGALGVVDGKYSDPTAYHETPAHYDTETLQDSTTHSIGVGSMLRAGDPTIAIGTGNSSTGVAGLSGSTARESSFPNQTVVTPGTTPDNFLPATTTASSVSAAQEFMSGTDHACVAYVNALGHALIDSARLTIGGQDINGTGMTGEFLHIWHQMHHLKNEETHDDNLFMYGDGTGAPLPETGNSAPQGILENVNPLYDEGHQYKLCKYKLKLPKPASAPISSGSANPTIEHGQQLTMRFFDHGKLTLDDDYHTSMSSAGGVRTGGLLGGEVHYSDIFGDSIMAFTQPTGNIGQSRGSINTDVHADALKVSRDGITSVGFIHSRTTELQTKLGAAAGVGSHDNSLTKPSTFETLAADNTGTLLGGWNWQTEHPFEKDFSTPAEIDVVLPLFADDGDPGFGVDTGTDYNGLELIGGGVMITNASAAALLSKDSTQTSALCSQGNTNNTLSSANASITAFDALGTRSPFRQGGSDGEFTGIKDSDTGKGTIDKNLSAGYGSDSNYATVGKKLHSSDIQDLNHPSELVLYMDAVPLGGMSTDGQQPILDIFHQNFVVDTDGGKTFGFSPDNCDETPYRLVGSAASTTVIPKLGMTKVPVAITFETINDSTSGNTSSFLKVCNLRILHGHSGSITAADQTAGFYLTISNKAATSALREWMVANGRDDPNSYYFGAVNPDDQIPTSSNFSNLPAFSARAIALGPFGYLAGTTTEAFPGLTSDSKGANAKLKSVTAHGDVQVTSGSGATIRVRKTLEPQYGPTGAAVLESDQTVALRSTYRLNIENPGTGYKVGDTLRISADMMPKHLKEVNDMLFMPACDIRIKVGQIQPDVANTKSRQNDTVNVTYQVEIYDENDAPLPGCVAAVSLVAQPTNEDTRGTNQGAVIAAGSVPSTDITAKGGGPNLSASGYQHYYGASAPSAAAGNPYAAKVLPWDESVLAAQCIATEKVTDHNVIPFRMGALSHAEFTVFEGVPSTGFVANPAFAGEASVVVPNCKIKLTVKKVSAANTGFAAGASTLWLSTASAANTVVPYQQSKALPQFANSAGAPMADWREAIPGTTPGWMNGNFHTKSQLTADNERTGSDVAFDGSAYGSKANPAVGLPFTGQHALCSATGNNCCDARSFYEACSRSTVHPLNSSSGLTAAGSDPEFSNQYSVTNTDPLNSAGGYDTFEFLALCPSLVGGNKLQRVNDTGHFSVSETPSACTGGVESDGSGMVHGASGAWTTADHLVNNTASKVSKNPEDPAEANTTDAEILKRRARLSTLQAVGSATEEHIRGSDIVTSVSNSGTAVFKDAESQYGASSRGHYSDLTKVKSRLGAVAHKLRANFVTTSDYASGTVALSNGSKKALKDGFAKRAHMSALGNCDHPDGTGRCVKVMVPIPFFYSPVYHVQSEGRTQSLPIIALQYHDVNIALQLKNMEDLIQTDHEARNMGLRCTSAAGLNGALVDGVTGRNQLDADQKAELKKFMTDSVLTPATSNGGFAFENKSSTVRKTFAGNKHCFATDIAAWGGLNGDGKPLDEQSKGKMASYTGQSGRTDNGGRSYCIPALGGTGAAHPPGNDSGTMAARQPGNMISGHIMVMTIFLDSVERKLFAQHEHEFLLKQVQMHSTSGNAVNNRSGAPFQISAKLPFNHPVTSLFWVLQRPESEYTRNYFRYEATQMSGDELMINAKLSLNNHNREPGMDQFATRCLQPQTYFDTAPAGGIGSATHDFGVGGAKNIYMYSFAQHPGKWWPSGAMNFSRIDDAQLQLNVKSHASQAHFGHNYCYAGGGFRKLADEIEFVQQAAELTAAEKTNLYYGKLSQGVNLRVYAQNYNILRISSGMGAIRYAN